MKTLRCLAVLGLFCFTPSLAPAAPPDSTPILRAGPDRITVLPAKTFLNPTLQGPWNHANLQATWSQSTGPGRANFDDAHALNTAASFSVPGDYTLLLTVHSDQTSQSNSLRVHVQPDEAMHPLVPVQITTSYQINSPFWKDRYRALLINWIPHCYEMISDPHLKEGGIENFVQAGNKLAGKPHQPHVGAVFANAWVYNTIETMCWAQMFDAQGDQQIMDAQAAMRMKLNEWIPIILSAQEPDGYIDTKYTLTGLPRWTNKWDHEGYQAGYFLEAAIAHYRMTHGQDRRLYDAAKRLADCWCNHIGPAPKLSWYEGHEELEQALVRFAQLVDEVDGAHAGDRYVALSKFLLDSRGDGEPYDQSQLPIIQQYEAVGHAVRAAYLYTGIAAMTAQTGDPYYQSAVQSIWSDLVNRKYYLTGGIGSGETPEGFGVDYSLPNKSYCESCASCGELFFQHNMNLAYHNAKYADLYEQTLYNGILSDLDLQGNNFTYTNELDSDHLRYPWHECPCCVGNFPRTLLQMPTWMYAKDANTAYVNLFIGSQADIGPVAGTDLHITQQTDYPLSGKVRIIVNPSEARDFTLAIRTPKREVSELYHATPSADGIDSISVNGQPITPTIQDGYAKITRTWHAGDQIDLTLPMKIQRMTASEQVAADHNRVALQYGPLIYNIETVDQDIDKPLAPNSELTTQWRSDLLDGVIVIHGQFTDGSPLLAIPNYARNNRGGRSIVWMRAQN
ncbi:MAG TPA: beta-L-arabinofuranosidase domain-containing protein [Tepidisphaeraceae bacterium]|jgi:hypothetical protein